MDREGDAYRKIPDPALLNEMGIHPKIVGQYLSAIGLLYGITLGLISVGAGVGYSLLNG